MYCNVMAKKEKMVEADYLGMVSYFEEIYSSEAKKQKVPLRSLEERLESLEKMLDKIALYREDIINVEEIVLNHEIQRQVLKRLILQERLENRIRR